MVGTLVTQAEAFKIAKSVERYWLERGYVVHTEVARSDVEVSGKGFFIVRSDLVNGFPKGMPRTIDAVWALEAFDRTRKKAKEEECSGSPSQRCW